MKKVKHLVVDSGAFIKAAPVHEFAENIYTVEGALREIKDKATRQRLQFLPYDLKIKVPSPDACKHVMLFSKKTGDYSSLSVTDLQIIALTYQLEKENIGTDHLNNEPNCKVTGQPAFIETELSGFFYPKKDISSCHDSQCDEINPVTEDSEEGNDDGNSSEMHEGKLTDENCKLENELSDYISEEDNDVSDDESWITSKNIGAIQQKMGMMMLDQESEACVACITTDFSVQNVLIQMGLRILSVDGMLIKNTRVFILRCYGCFKTTNNMSKKFCPNCGNKTLKKVAVSVNPDGTRKIHINFRKPINLRGTRYSLPMPKGGRHSTDPVVCEDQKVPENRPSKLALTKIDALALDYEALVSPFAQNDVYSRAFNLGITRGGHRNQRRNPNEWSLRTGNRKKKK